MPGGNVKTGQNEVHPTLIGSLEAILGKNDKTYLFECPKCLEF